MSIVRRAASVFALFAATACAGKHKAVFGSPSDYADYRATRVAPSVPERLKAAALYLTRHPDGAFHEEVSRWFERVEPLFFEASADSLSGVQTYLDALPAGPHAAGAEQRRDAFRAAAKSDAGERISERGAAFERRLAAAAQAREDVVTAYSTWVGHLLDFNGWGRPLDDKANLGSEWLAEPKPKCGRDRCTKLISLPYELEVSGKPEKFVCILEVTIFSTKGRVTSATVSGPDLFARLFEAHEARPAGPREERSGAVAWAVELTSGAAERRLPQGRCARQGAEKAALVRECQGWRLDVVPASATDEQDDRVVIRGPSAL